MYYDTLFVFVLLRCLCYIVDVVDRYVLFFCVVAVFVIYSVGVRVAEYTLFIPLPV